MFTDEEYMRRALALAGRAAEEDEVPVGALILHGDTVIAEAYNRREGSRCATHHAEILAIEAACRALGGWRLPNCKLYVTLEPCQMCAGAIVQARIPKVVMASMNPKAGCAGSILNILEMPQFNHQVEVVRGVLDEECSTMLKEFFVELRMKHKKEKELFNLMDEVIDENQDALDELSK